MFGRLYGQFKGPFGAILWVVLWEYHFSHLSLRIKGVIACFCVTCLLLMFDKMLIYVF